MARKGSKAAFRKRMKRKAKKGPKMKKWEIALLAGAFIIAIAYVIAVGKLGLAVPSKVILSPTPTVTATPVKPVATPPPSH